MDLHKVEDARVFLNDSEHLQNSRLINVSGDSLDLFIRYYDIITSSADSAFNKLWLLPSTVIHTTPGLVRPTRSSCRQTNTWVVGVLNNFFRVQPIHLPLTCRHTMSPPTSPGLGVRLPIPRCISLGYHNVICSLS